MKIFYKYSYDLFVIGGGSGGLASSRAASQIQGKKIGLADYVQPTIHGQTWGAGGTCVNVGCIPKKMFHVAAQLGDFRKDQTKVGWSGVDEKGEHDWNHLVQGVNNYIKRLNSMYENIIKIAGIQYYNSTAKLIDNHTIELTDASGSKSIVTAKDIIISVGARPKLYDGIDPHSYITSDDLFWMRKPPGKTLVVGGSYVALECAGFLNGLGYDTSVLVRSRLLRKFDQQYASFIGQFMSEQGVKFHYGCTPTSIQNKEVTWVDKSGKTYKENFDTVLMAISRTAQTKTLGLENVGVKVDENGKIIVNEKDQTNCGNIYALGDCVSGRMELTPTAIMAGRKLIKRLYQGGKDLMDYTNVATTVFTPLEYSCIGLSEEMAVQQYGRDNLKIFENVFKPVTWNISARNSNICQGKLIVNRDTDKIVGYHYLGPEAAEVTQGFSVAIKMGATKGDFDSTVGIHPSAAEEMVQMKKFR